MCKKSATIATVHVAKRRKKASPRRVYEHGDALVRVLLAMSYRARLSDRL